MFRRLAYVSVAVSIALAAASLALAQGRGGGAQGAPAAGANVATPRMPDGHPDLSGVWGGGGGGGGGRPVDDDGSGNLSEVFPSRRCAPNQVKCSEYTNQSEDGEFTARIQRQSARLQARVLGQGPGARHVDQQGRSAVRLPAARYPARRRAHAHRPDRQRRGVLYARAAAAQAPPNTASSRPTAGSSIRRSRRTCSSGATPWVAGKATRSSSTRSPSTI